MTTVKIKNIIILSFIVNLLKKERKMKNYQKNFI